MVVGFHHKKGSIVEYVYPPFRDEPLPIDQIGIPLPPAWKDLPSLALPDGAHKYDNDIVYFHLPSIDEPKRTIFAVSCLMQVESSHFKSKDLAVTRSSVLKAICVFSAVPLFGLISSKVALATHVWFRQEDFSDVDLLKDLYKSLAVAVPSPICPDISILSIDLELRTTIVKFGKKLIRLFKVLLLEPRVMFLIEPTAEMSKTILGFLSLYPSMLEKGLLLSAVSPHVAPPPTPVSSSASNRFSFSSTERVENDESNINDPESCHSKKSDLNLSSIQSTIDLISRSLITDNCGFPLAIFGPENACLPYVSVSFLERLPLLSSYVIGCTNILYLHKCDHDVLIQVDSTGSESPHSLQQQPNGRLGLNFKIVFKDRLLKKIVKPTPSDQRFIGWIIKTLEHDAKSGDPYFAGSNWVGSDEWIREQFKHYLLGLLSSVAHDNEKLMESYGSTFITAWRRKLNYSVWQRTVDAKSYPRYLHPGDDITAAGNFVLSSNIFGSASLLSGASSTAVQMSSKAADGAKKFLIGRVGGLMSKVWGTGSGHSQAQSPNPIAETQRQTSRPHSSISDLAVHSNQKHPATPPISQKIDDRGEDSTENFKRAVGKEDESQL